MEHGPGDTRPANVPPYLSGFGAVKLMKNGSAQAANSGGLAWVNHSSPPGDRWALSQKVLPT